MTEHAAGADPLPAGLTVRGPRLDDAEALTVLITACDVAVLGHSDATVTQTAADLAAPGYDRERAGVVVEDAAGALVGWLWTEDDAEAATVFIDAYSRDAAVTRWLIGRAIEYVRGLAVERGRTLVLDSGSYEHDTDLVAALDRAGLDVRRRFYRMRIDLAGASWPVPPRPPGVALRNPDPADEETYRLLHRLVDTSFAAHWNYTTRTYEDWRRLFDASAGQDPAQWWVADVDGEPAAVLVGDDSRAEIGMAWVGSLGVLAAYRGRGLGKLLLRNAFAAAAARGMTAVGLAVDSENETGATALYESVGMRAESVMLAWQRTVQPS